MESIKITKPAFQCDNTWEDFIGECKINQNLCVIIVLTE